MKIKLVMWMLAVALTGCFAVAPSLMAQENSSSGGGAQSTTGSSSQSTKSTTTTTSKSAEPVQTTVTRTTGVDPVWLVAGAIGLIAIVAIIALASRGGRSRDTATVVHERETVVKK